MRLERLLTHRIIRVVRAMLPFVVLALIAVPAWNFYARRARSTDSPRDGVKLPSGITVRTEGFKISRQEGGRTKFTIQAKEALGSEDKKYVLKEVDATIYGDTDQDPPRQIRCENGSYDQSSNDFTCTGRVEVRLDDNTLVRTDEVIYSHGAGSVVAPKAATIERGGTRASANGFEYLMNAGLLTLTGDVRVKTDNNVEMETAAAQFQQKEHWARMSGGVLLKSATGWVRGASGRAALDPQTFRPNTVTIEGGVSAESHSAAQETFKLSAQWLESAMSKDGNPERVQARGGVEIEKIAGDARQRLSGSEVDTTLKDGKVEVLEARQNARLVFGDGQSLESQQIWTNAAGSVRTTDNSVLKVGDSTIEGREFTIENGQEIVTFNTPRPASLKKAGGVESSSEQTRAAFKHGTNELVELVQTGNFQFRTPQYDGRAQTGRFAEGGTVVTLQGNPVVNASDKRLEAAEIRVNQKDNSFVATKNVSTVLKNTRESLLVKADRAEGGGEAILYTGAVQLWRGDAYIKAAKLDAAVRGDQKTKVHAEGGSAGQVQSYLQNMRVSSDVLDYDDAQGVARYLGRVHAKKQDMILETPDMTVRFRDNNVSEIVADGNVTVTRGEQRGTGDRAVYDAAKDLVTLTGNAEVKDKDRLFRGSVLTVGNKGQTASIEGKDGQRTVTRIPVKKSPGK